MPSSAFVKDNTDGASDASGNGGCTRGVAFALRSMCACVRACVCVRVCVCVCVRVCVRVCVCV